MGESEHAVRDDLCDCEITLERWKMRSLRQKAVVLVAREFVGLGPAIELSSRELRLLAALKDLDDWEDHHRGLGGV